MKYNEVLLGDCFDTIKTLDDESIDLIVTSPPYADIKSYGKQVNVLHPDNYNTWIMPLFIEMYRVLKKSGSIIWNIGDRVIKKQRHPFALELPARVVNETKLKFYDRYFWNKPGIPNGNKKRLNNFTEFIYHFVKDIDNIKFNMDNVRENYKEISKKRYKSKMNFYKTNENGIKEMVSQKIKSLNPKGKTPEGLFTFPNNSNTKGNKHPAPFSIDLPLWFIKALTDDGDIVLDTFMGSGTTAEAAMILNRKWIGLEINKEYLPMIKNRTFKPINLFL